MNAAIMSNNDERANQPRGSSLALAISRDGRTLVGAEYLKKPILLFSESDNSSSHEIIIGRLEILSAQHRSCSCSCTSTSSVQNANPWSTQDKCDNCSAVNEWAVTALSRRLLRFTCDDDDDDGKEHRVYVQGRGTHATIHVGTKLLATENDVWSEKILVQPGEKIRLASPEKDGKKSLHVVVLLKEQLEEEALRQRGGQRSIALQTSLEQQHASPDDSSSVTPKLQRKCLDAETMLNPTADDTSISAASGVRCSGEEVSSLSSNPAKRKSDCVNEEKQKYILFLVPLGHDMSSVRRTFLANKAIKLGMAETDDVFCSTHIVISHQVSTVREVSTILNLEESDLRSYIEQNDISCVLPRWIAAAEMLRTPDMLDIWHGDINKRQSFERKKSERTGRNLQFEQNKEIAEVFRILSNLHQSCPLLEMDQWKAYMFRIIAGRLTHLDFEINNDPQTLSRLRKIKGIGSNSIDKIQEYLKTGALRRIGEFNTDPKRVAMKNMMNIWGVGRKTALDLIHREFRDISDVRIAIREGRHFLDRNQLVGVDCYEDILEEMERDEVKMIGDLVDEVVQEIFPNAVVQIMGSYRRLKATCGDIDIHITHKSFVKKNPDQGLSRIVDMLWERGHILYHLTFLPGMETGSKVSDYMNSSRHIPKDAWKASKPVGYMTSKGSHGSSYMGVARSPKMEGKRRRIDIKLYPWRERIFASLYFTGNGYFNRSMRLWASRKFRYTLNDHGLFYGGTTDRVMEASSEIEVFDRLNLVYKEPHERDSFDAVLSKTGPAVEVELSEAEFKEDKNYIWVK